MEVQMSSFSSYHKAGFLINRSKTIKQKWRSQHILS